MNPAYTEFNTVFTDPWKWLQNGKKLYKVAPEHFKGYDALHSFLQYDMCQCVHMQPYS